MFNVPSVLAWIAAYLLNDRGRSTLAMWLLTLEVAADDVLYEGKTSGRHRVVAARRG